MDIVQILRDAINRLPEGDHKPGLLAVMRHIGAAIRHLERGADTEEDACTDAIYRTNQAFEGSLKEAYRVLADKDPSGMAPYQIESYLEDNKLIRPRVLTQLTRYRQDYRNPSAHDYKLDFDEDEALLAILSVTGFGKLLVDQISERLAFKVASETPPHALKGKIGVEFEPQKREFDFTRFIVTFTKDFVELYGRDDTTESEFEGRLAGYLVSVGATIDLGVLSSRAGGIVEWDMVASDGSLYIPIEIKAGARSVTAVDQAIKSVLAGMNILHLETAVLVLRDKGASRYTTETRKVGDKTIFLIAPQIDKRVRAAKKSRF